MSHVLLAPFSSRPTAVPGFFAGLVLLAAFRLLLPLLDDVLAVQSVRVFALHAAHLEDTK